MPRNTSIPAWFANKIKAIEDAGWRRKKDRHKPKLYIYVVQAIGTEFYKVGVSKDTNNRLKGLQTSCPHKLRIRFEILCRNAARWEREIHKKLSGWRVQGEWFAVPEERLVQVIDGMKQVVKRQEELRQP